MLEAIYFLLLMALSASWIAFRSLRTNALSVPVNFWWFYFPMVALGLRVPLYLYWEQYEPWLLHLYLISGPLNGIPLMLAGVYAVARPELALKGIRASFLGKLHHQVFDKLKLRLDSGHQAVQQMRWSGVGMTLAGLLVSILTVLTFLRV